MKFLLLILCLSLTIPALAQSQDEFELKPSQSMLMTGKGPGQDGAINPYAGQDCYAIVENLGETEVSIRIQQKGKILKVLGVDCMRIMATTTTCGSIQPTTKTWQLLMMEGHR